MILTSDWHLHERSAHTVLEEVIPWVADYADRSGDLDVACLGDLFHVRNKVSVRLLNDLVDRLKEFADRGVSWTLLPGNHDQYEVGGRNALEVLGEIDGVSVWTEPGWDHRGLWVPYRKHWRSLAEALELPAPPDSPRVAYMHCSVVGAWMNDGVQASEGVDPAALSGFDVVFSGHYHRHHRVQNVVYVGSPYQTRADEAGQEKGVVQLFAGGTWEFAPVCVGKRYHKFAVRSRVDLEALDLSAVVPGDEVRVQSGVGLDPEVVSAALTASGVDTHVVTPEQGAFESRLAVGGDESIRAYAEAYVDSVGSGLDRSELMRVFEELTS